MGALKYPDGPAVQKRRSDRILICIPLFVHGTDPNGQNFADRAVTQMMARFGASIVTNLPLYPEQELTLKPTDRRPIRARVIGQTSIVPEGHVYGIAFLNSTSDAWGVYFPPLPEPVSDTVVLECCKCHACESVRMSELEFDVFRANSGLGRMCSQCRHLTTWRLAEDALARKPAQSVHACPPDSEEQPATLDTSSQEVLPAQATQPQRRLHPRVSVNVKACIAQPGSEQDIVTAINMSRGGILARSVRLYPTESWIQLAVPFIPAAANIFVAARVVWRADVQGTYHYGIEYVRS